MPDPILMPPNADPPRKFWKLWKWIGLLAFGIAFILQNKLPDAFVSLAYLCGIIVLINLAFAVPRYLKNRIFWRVRNRLIGAFIFVGVIPLLTLIGIGILSGYVLFGQLGKHYLQDALQQNSRRISELGAEIAGRIPAGDPTRNFQIPAASTLKRHSAEFPRAAARLLRRSADGSLGIAAAYDPQAMLRDLPKHPGDKWRGDNPSFEGILRDGNNLFLTSLQPLPGHEGFYLEAAVPVDNVIQDRIRREKSLYVTFMEEAAANVAASDKDTRLVVSQGKHSTRIQPRQADTQENYWKSDSRSMIVWPALNLYGKSYESGEYSAVHALIHAPWSVLFTSFLAPALGESFIVIAIYVLGGLFAVTELISLVIGFTISRRVTRSVHDMHKGILALQKGDLQHTIPVRRNDQLGLMAHAFNQMTGSISRLMEEVVEKKKLEKELEIAREVQATLFPKQLPCPPGMSVFGGCKPARVVSGDYYDFIVEDESHLNIVVGDISGKGISAALLMANLQAAMRSQLLTGKHHDPEAAGNSLAEVMTHLNQQIYLSSPPEKYATLFLSRYDADTRRLWYCNAGHLPPIILDAGGSRALEPTGTVVGLLPNARYEAKCVELPPGTMLAIFTDGITEAVNKADEEFGEKRLLETLQQSHALTPEAIWQRVVHGIAEWQSDLQQHDDITLIVAKTR